MNYIKPIQTVYKGYRFRSRLEARWAVFFDALGIEWEYEPQGFDLGGEWYLPDFWLPESQTWVEIKPRLAEPEPVKKFYLAGKIAPHDWRHAIVPNLRSYSWDDGDIWFGYKAKYTGPHFVSDDHCGAHGPSTHGNEGFYPTDNVHAKCLAAVKRCDVFFMWLDSPDAYGSLAELGYAAALGKKIVIAIEPELHRKSLKRVSVEEKQRTDFWFVEEFGESHVADNPMDVLHDYLPDKPEPLTKLERLCAGQGNSGLLIEGSPWWGEYEVSHTKSYSGQFCVSPNTQKILVVPHGARIPETESVLESALTAARQARFEHGETPNG